MPLFLIINPGSTSTKLALYDGDNERVSESAGHSSDMLAAFPKIPDQLGFRLAAADAFLEKHKVSANDLTAVVGRGGLLKPLEGGVYAVNDAMRNDLASCRYGSHASNLGGLIAAQIAARAGCPAFIVDPVVVDELDDIARLTGLPDISRISIFHALNQKSVAREVAGAMGRRYENCRFIIAHLGGGISVAAHLNGRAIDVNNALGGDGPFSPERAGSLPVFQLLDLAFSGKYSCESLKKRIVGGGGLVAHLGTNNLIEAMKRVNSGDAKARQVVEAMAYRIAREISSLGAALYGDVDRIIITGGLANDDVFVSMIRARVRYLAEVVVIPGENEMIALARGASAALNGTLTVKEYQS